MKKRTLYSLYHQVATVGKINYMIPFCKLEVAPGDTFSGRVGLLLRFSPLKRALLQDLLVDQYFFYVPHRLVDSNWETFMAQGPNAVSPTTAPSSTAATGDPALFVNKNGTLSTTLGFNLLPRRAYNLVYNEYFRDELITPVAADDIPAGSGVGTAGVRRVGAKRHWLNEVRDNANTGNDATAPVAGAAFGSLTVQAEEILRAIAQQKLQMRRATYGTRYVDILRSFGVNVNYQMLQRPELVAAAHGSVNVTDVVSTSGVTAELGKLAGHAVSGSRLSIRRKSFPEHGTLLGLLCVRFPQVDTYMVDRMDNSLSYEDFYDPALELLPTRQVLPNQHYWNQNSGLGTTAGYAPWGQWYRSAMNRCHISIRDWVGEQFGPAFAPTTNMLWAAFRQAGWGDTDVDSLFNDVTKGHFQVAAVNSLRALRMISPGNPGIGSITTGRGGV